MKEDIFKKFQDFIIEQPLNEMFSWFENKRKIDKNRYSFWKHLYEKLKKPKLCAAQFSKNPKAYLTLDPGGVFLLNLISQRWN
jgi:hypothetical protein